MAAGMAVQTVGSMRDGAAQAEVGRANQRVADQAAQTEREIGAFNVARERRVLRRQLGEQRAAAGAQGTALIGQPVDILAASERQAELDLQAIRFDSELRARNLETQADFRRFEGRQARQTGFTRAGTALLTGGSRIAARLGNG